MSKRIICYFMSIVLAMGVMVCIRAGEVKAASQAEDIVSIAKSQIGIKERSSGSDDIIYNDWFYGRRVNNNGESAKYAWCAVFVSWCAKEAGIPVNIIPKTASTSDMKNRLTGGTSHLKGSGYVPKRGDIIFFGTNASQHVGIVEYSSQNTVYYIDGNNTQTNPHGVHYSSCSLSYGSLWGFVTPNYRVSSIPTNPQISKNQHWYDIKDRIELTAHADGASSYFMTIFKDGNKIISKSVDNGMFSFDASAYGYGNYSAYFSCSNAAGTVDTKWVEFSVVEAASYSNVYVSSGWYDLTDVVTIGVQTVCAKGQVIGIDKEGAGRVVTERTEPVYKISASKLGIGRYSAYFSVFNGSGGVDTRRVTFEIVDRPKGGAVVSTAKKQYSLNDRIKISVSVDCAKGSVIGIDKEGYGRVVTQETRNGTYSVEASKLGAGKYSAYFSVYNSSGGYDTGRVKFEVACRHNYSSKIIRQPGCMKNGVREYKCEICGHQYTEEIPAIGHLHTRICNVQEATCMTEGYSGDTYCEDCGEKISSGWKVAETGHTWDEGKIIEQATANKEGIRLFCCISCGKTKTELIPAEADGKQEATDADEKHESDADGKNNVEEDEDDGGKQEAADKTGQNDKDDFASDSGNGADEYDALAEELEVGDEIEDHASNAEYEVISIKGSEVCVEYVECMNRAASVIHIPDQIRAEGGAYCKVTAISKRAFKNNKKIKEVLIGNNVETIGTKAFYGCRNLSNLSIGSKVRKIGAQAFCGCPKLKRLNIKTKHLLSGGLNKKTFRGLSAKAVIQVPKGMKKTYKKLFCMKGLNRKTKIR